MRYWKAGHRPPLCDDHVFIAGLGIGDALYLVFNGPIVESGVHPTAKLLDGTMLSLRSAEGSAGVLVAEFAFTKAQAEAAAAASIAAPVSQLDVELAVEGVTVLRVRINQRQTDPQ
jgi:hypothetical protein